MARTKRAAPTDAAETPVYLAPTARTKRDAPTDSAETPDNGAPAARPVALYVGSSTDVWPVLDLPQYDWILLTATPTDPDDVWYKNLAKFQATIRECLASYDGMDAWVLIGNNIAQRQWVFACGKRRLTVYHSSWFPDDMSDAAKKDIKIATVLYAAGWLPELQQDVVKGLKAGLCPVMAKFYMHENMVMMKRAQSLLSDIPHLEHVKYRVRDGYWVVLEPVVASKPNSFRYVWGDDMDWGDDMTEEAKGGIGKVYKNLVLGADAWPAAIPACRQEAGDEDVDEDDNEDHEDDEEEDDDEEGEKEGDHEDDEEDEDDEEA